MKSMRGGRTNEPEVRRGSSTTAAVFNPSLAIIGGRILSRPRSSAPPHQKAPSAQSLVQIRAPGGQVSGRPPRRTWGPVPPPPVRPSIETPRAGSPQQPNTWVRTVVCGFWANVGRFRANLCSALVEFGQDAGHTCLSLHRWSTLRLCRRQPKARPARGAMRHRRGQRTVCDMDTFCSKLGQN